MGKLLFKELDLSPEIQKALTEMGFEEATPIQSRAIPRVMEGKDIVGQAQTGTGKTCAFGIPAIEMLDMELSGPQVLILCPTRELAIQMSEELKKVSKYKKGVRILPIYGGQSIDMQIFALKKKPQIIIGTPGRVMDHLRRRTIRLDDLKMMILDEADEMLNMGFREDIDIILQDIPEERQTLLFSATMAPEIMSLTKKYQKEPEIIKATHKEITVPLIEQYYFEVREASKVELLCRLIDAKNITLGMVFCNTKKKVDEVTERLQARGYSAEALHGDMKQTERDRVMKKFRTGKVDILVATDVAARGIDVNNIEAVFNYDIPNDEEYYVHRIGRTGRAGNAGVAYSFVFGREIYKLKDIQRYTKSKILPMKPPSVQDVEGVRMEAAAERLKEVITGGEYKKYTPVIEKVLDEFHDEEEEHEALDDGKYITSIDVAAALFKIAFEEFEKRNYEFADFDDENMTLSNKDMARIFINVGSMDHIQPGNLVQGIASRTTLPGKMIGSIDIHKNFSFVEVPIEYVDDVLEGMKDFQHRGRHVVFEKASKRQRPSGSSGGRSRNRKPSSSSTGGRGESGRKNPRGGGSKRPRIRY